MLHCTAHNVLRSSSVVVVRQIFFVINQTLQMIVMVLVMMVDRCAHLFLCLGPLLGPLGGPEGALEAPKISQNSVSCFDYLQCPEMGWTRLKVGGT